MSENQKMVPAFGQGLVMNFFANQHQQALFASLVVAIQPLNQTIVVRNKQGINPGIQAGFGEVLVKSVAVGIVGVHVQGDD